MDELYKNIHSSKRIVELGLPVFWPQTTGILAPTTGILAGGGLGSLDIPGLRDHPKM